MTKFKPSAGRVLVVVMEVIVDVVVVIGSLADDCKPQASFFNWYRTLQATSRTRAHSSEVSVVAKVTQHRHGKDWSSIQYSELNEVPT